MIWKREEEVKFKAYLKQQEYEKIEEITTHWKGKELERERLFNESLHKVQELEKQLDAKTMELKSRESKIITVEQELKGKIQDVS